MRKSIIILSLLSISFFSFSQKKEDTIIIKNSAVDPALKKDTLKRTREKTPGGAAIRSAILPGWGQVYNKKYWKVPIVYGALGTTGVIFAYNLKTYRQIRFAYTVLLNKDSANFSKVVPGLQPFIAANDVNSLRANRDAFRKNIDYSVLFFLLFWGLNVVDATVDAHLRSFNVNNDLSLKIKPCLQPRMAGISIVMNFK